MVETNSKKQDLRKAPKKKEYNSRTMTGGIPPVDNSNDDDYQYGTEEEHEFGYIGICDRIEQEYINHLYSIVQNDIARKFHLSNMLTLYEKNNCNSFGYSTKINHVELPIFKSMKNYINLLNTVKEFAKNEHQNLGIIRLNMRLRDLDSKINLTKFGQVRVTNVCDEVKHVIEDVHTFYKRFAERKSEIFNKLSYNLYELKENLQNLNENEGCRDIIAMAVGIINQMEYDNHTTTSRSVSGGKGKGKGKDKDKGKGKKT